jgi:hypothetical protein
VYFQDYAQERSINTSISARYDIDLLHVRPYAIGSYVNTRERPGFEIDVRARRFEHMFGFGADVPLTRRVVFGVLARRQDISYAADAVFLGTYLRDAFDRREDAIEASFRYKLTPLTTLVLKGNAEKARFNYSPLRNSDGVRITPGVEFDAFAIIQGSAFVGLRKLDMLGPRMPDYKGVIASVDLGYTLLGRTRFAVQVARDVYFSFEQSWPYYVQTGATLTITQRIAGPFDAQARFGRQNLDYARMDVQTLDPFAAVPDRQDTVYFYGGGFGYHIGQSARLGFNVDSVERRSPLYQRTYKGMRVGTALTYGF